MRKFARTLALLYAVVVGLAAIWAWYVDVTLLHAMREHMLPGLLLAFLSLPTSYTLGPLYEHFPTFFSAPFVQLTWLTVCGAFQAVVLYSLSVRVPKAHGVV
nr:orf102EGC133 [uncultured bacterium]